MNKAEPDTVIGAIVPVSRPRAALTPTPSHAKTNISQPNRSTYLVSESASFVHAAVLPVHGGRIAV